VAGFGKGTADVKLSPDGAGTLLAYSAKAQVGGKLAQVGSRLIDSAAAKIAEDFFSAFTERLAPPEAEAPAAEAAVPAAAPPGVVVKPWLPWAIAALLIIIVLVYLLD
jgi:hypothetical protein